MYTILFASLILSQCTNINPNNNTCLLCDHHEFNNFIDEYQKNYFKEDYQTRCEIFTENHHIINEHNKDFNNGIVQYEMGINPFSDLTTAEFFGNGRTQKKKLSLKHNSKTCTQNITNIPHHNKLPIPSSIDWRKEGAVTNVKNQGQCGSCWSFSAIGAFEGYYYIKTGHLLNFSEQQLVDCSKDYGNDGCEGGMMDFAFFYIMDNGLCNDYDYKYIAIDDKCHDDCKIIPDSKIDGCIDVPPNNEHELTNAVTRGPVSVAIQADQRSFQFYKSGVYHDVNCGNDLDHGVLIVGYGNEDQHNYWIVKNSWGDQWGEIGYIKILRGSGYDSPGICGIAMSPSYPI